MRASPLCRCGNRTSASCTYRKQIIEHEDSHFKFTRESQTACHCILQVLSHCLREARMWACGWLPAPWHKLLHLPRLNFYYATPCFLSQERATPKFTQDMKTIRQESTRFKISRNYEGVLAHAECFHSMFSVRMPHTTVSILFESGKLFILTLALHIPQIIFSSMSGCRQFTLWDTFRDFQTLSKIP